MARVELFSGRILREKKEKEFEVPQYLKERYGRLEAADDLIDDCKYLLYFADGWGIDDGWDAIGCYPVKSKKEALDKLKEAVECGYNEKGCYVPKSVLERGK